MPDDFQLRIELEDIDPAIWRRISVSSSLTLFELHVVIQGAMGWHDSHLHMFEISGKHYEVPDGESLGSEPGFADERQYTLAALLSEGMIFSYVYDLGDDWRHLITVEARDDSAQGWALPHCVAGERACPPEDCGGPFGYPDFLDILSNPEHSDHENCIEWANGFEPDVFSVTQANSLIAALCQLYRERGTAFGG